MVDEGELASKVAVNTEQIRVLGAELERLRARAHRLESDREGVRLLRKAVAELQEDLPNLARQTARETYYEFRRGFWSNTFKVAGLAIAAASAGAAVAAVVLSLVR